MELFLIFINIFFTGSEWMFEVFVFGMWRMHGRYWGVMAAGMEGS